MKTFEAESMAEALKRVKVELGADAVILHTRTYRRGGLLGFGKRTVVEVTAANDVNIAPRPRPRKGGASVERSVLKASENTADSRLPGGFAAGTFGNAVQRAYAQGTPVEMAQPQAQPGAAVPQLRERNLVQATVPPTANVNEELAQIRGMVQQMMRRQSSRPQPDLPDALFDQYLALLEQEVAEELADEVIQSVRGKLTDQQIEDKQQVRDAVGKEIARLIPVDAKTELESKTTDGRPRVIALIGPTGVGKTTTIAKLAATFKLREKKKVALITIDTYRIAAVDQLRTYADIIRLPLHVVLTAQELRDAIDKCSDYDVVLIDTAGRGQRDDDKLTELSGLLRVADPHEVHLVLSSTCSQKVAMEAVERFSRLRIDRIIFTKLDEAVSLGVLLNVVRRVNKQLSYVTTGQDVPHQIEPGRSDRLAELILGTGL
ncbi:flagellar biosynthesis protein FlhF [Planctomycetales bacterium ZRK34]|nr:flagellar biosynthesis protein FlhF [Planctomycetales bacterium ZRK34]